MYIFVYSYTYSDNSIKDYQYIFNAQPNKARNKPH